MKKALVLTSGVLSSFVLPIVVSAQEQVNDLFDVGDFIINTINDIIVPVIFAVAFIVFLWGRIRYVYRWCQL